LDLKLSDAVEAGLDLWVTHPRDVDTGVPLAPDVHAWARRLQGVLADVRRLEGAGSLPGGVELEPFQRSAADVLRRLGVVQDGSAPER
jgi:hypothetical protein